MYCFNIKRLMATDPRITVDPYTSKSSEIMRARREKINTLVGHDLAHIYPLKTISQHMLPYVDQQQIGSNNLSATLVQTSRCRATLDDLVSHVNSTRETDDGAPNDSYVAISGKDKAQEVNHNIVHDVKLQPYLSHDY